MTHNREQQKQAAAQTHICRTCQEDLPKDSFWPMDWRSHRDRGISCKVCQQRPASLPGTVPLASAAVHTCARCGQEKQRAQYWPADWDNRHQTILCKACQPLPPDSRGCGQGHLPEVLRQRNEAIRKATFLCALCQTERPRDEFWPGDLKNRSRDTFGCKECKPVPPSERCRKKAQSATQQR